MAELVYRTCLENKSILKGTGGSNPSLTASFLFFMIINRHEDS